MHTGCLELSGGCFQLQSGKFGENSVNTKFSLDS